LKFFEYFLILFNILLLDRNGKVGMLFTEEDGRFIDLSEPAYSTSERIRTLGSLGMITDTLSGKLLLDRARSVQYLPL
jgi:hypothetical protein